MVPFPPKILIRYYHTKYKNRHLEGKIPNKEHEFSFNNLVYVSNEGQMKEIKKRKEGKKEGRKERRKGGRKEGRKGGSKKSKRGISPEGL